MEIYNNHGQPFLLVPLQDAIKKKMHRRVVFVILKDDRNRVLITKSHKNTKQKSELWNLSAYGDVFAGESTEGSAFRILRECFDIIDISIHDILVIPFMEHDATLYTSIFKTGAWRNPVIPNQEFIIDSMFVDKDELTGLLEFQPEAFHSLLVWAMRSNWIFN